MNTLHYNAIHNAYMVLQKKLPPLKSKEDMGKLPAYSTLL